MTAKRLELLRELVPTARSIAFLVNPGNPGFANVEAKEVQEAARVLGINLLVLNWQPSRQQAPYASSAEPGVHAALLLNFRHQGKKAIEKVARNQPAAYLKILALAGASRDEGRAFRRG